jgi:hypothetical protein
VAFGKRFSIYNAPSGAKLFSGLSAVQRDWESERTWLYDRVQTLFGKRNNKNECTSYRSSLIE